MTGKSTINVAVHGAAGRVGHEVLLAISDATDMNLTVAIDRVPRDLVASLPLDVPYYTDVGAALEAHASDVIVDFSLAAATISMVPQALSLGVRPVIGTTGFTDEQVDQIRKLCSQHRLGGFLAPNFTIGAVLLGRLAALAAPYFDYVDVGEEHHEMKVDAPSGTALSIARAIHEAHPQRFAHNDPEREPLEGTRGGDYEGISIHAARMQGRMAHHQVTFGGPGQTLTLRHDTNNRECYIPGVLMAVRKVKQLRSLTIGLDKLMGL